MRTVLMILPELFMMVTDSWRPGAMVTVGLTASRYSVVSRFALVVESDVVVVEVWLESSRAPTGLQEQPEWPHAKKNSGSRNM